MGWSRFFTVTPNHLNDTGLWAYFSGNAGGGGSVPEPGSLLLAGAAPALLVGQRRRAR